MIRLKKNPTIEKRQDRDDDLGVPLSSLLNRKNKRKKKEKVDLAKDNDWESDHGSASFKMVSLD